MSPRTKTLALLATMTALALAVALGVLREGGSAVRAEAADAVVRPPRGPRRPAEAAAGGRADAAADRAGDRVSVVVPPTAPAEPAGASWDEGFDARALYGTVFDEDLGPVAGARCVLWRSGERSYEDYGPPLAECATNAEGRFRFPELDELTEYRLYVEVAGFLPVLESRRTGVDEEIALRAAAPIRGRVIDAASKAPLAGVRVSISGVLLDADGALQTEATSTTDDQGSYALDRACVDRVQRVAVLPPGGWRVVREFQVNPDKPDGYDVELQRGAPFALRLYDLDTNAPFAEQEVDLGNGVIVLTDARGLARLDAPGAADLNEGRIYVSANPEGMCRTTRMVTVPPGGLAEPLDLPILRGARVTGVVSDAEGAPVEGATVRARTRQRSLEGYDLPPGTAVRSSHGHVETDADGAFTVTGLLPGDREVRVSADHPEHPPATSDPFFLATAKAVHEVDLKLDGGATVEGTVTLNGEPVRARVWWRSRSADDGGNGSDASNDAGSYRLRGVAAGGVTLGASVATQQSWGGDDHTEEISVDAGQVLVHDLRIAKNRATISGRVRDASGAALAGVSVTGWANDEGRNDWHHVTDKTGADGTFGLAVDDTPGVSWSLWAGDGDRHASLSDVPVGASNLELVLPRTGKLRLEIVDEVTRASVQRFNLYWRERGSEEGFRSLSQGGRELSPGPDGVYEAELPVGTLDLRVSARSQGYAPADLPNVVVVEGGSGSTSLVALQKGVTVEITFVDLPADGARRRFTFVTEEQRAELERQRWSDYGGREIHGAQRAQPGPDGKAVLKAMLPGRYSVWQPPKGYVFEPDTFEVPPVDVHHAEIRCRYETDEEQQQRLGTGELNALGGLGYAGG
jgi:protocatechuate 3,4-dioxygenase beta subunit